MSQVFGSNMNDPLFGGMPKSEQVDYVRVDTLHRVLEFLGYDLLDLRENLIVRRRVAYFLNVAADVERSAEVLELEQQWNPLGTK
ncbi:MAG: hypothetical protein AAGK78_09380 [Planctomycetota bacterium]